MRFEHPDHPGRAVRLAYCLNVHPGDTLGAVLTGMGEITVPLAERLGASEGSFGVGPYLPAAVASELARDAAARARWLAYLDEHRLDAFTFNAFPFGGFHRPGLKAGVFRPTWAEPERAAFTADVAELALEAWERGGRRAAHVSISTHTGMHGSDLRGEEDLEACAAGFVRACAGLAHLERTRGCRIVLALEPEPRSLANDTGALLDLRRRVMRVAEEQGFAEEVARHLGTCLDTCHAAVEFEDVGDAWDNATAGGAVLGKIQFSSALALAEPDRHDDGRALLFALDEEVYLHQVTARAPDGRLERAGDLPEARELHAAGAPGWRDSAEWRCHFHVPVDLAAVGESTGLRTTRPFADALLAHALASPDRWGGPELHLEIETYTWDVLPDAARGTGDRVDGLEREYRHVLAGLAAAGWSPASDPGPDPGA